jgi:hypothetical protein
LAIFLQTIDDYEKCSFGFIPFYFGFCFSQAKTVKKLPSKKGSKTAVKKLPEKANLIAIFPSSTKNFLLIPKKGTANSDM